MKKVRNSETKNHPSLYHLKSYGDLTMMFDNIYSLLDYVLDNGIDPSHTIYKGGNTTHETVMDYQVC